MHHTSNLDNMIQKQRAQLLYLLNIAPTEVLRWLSIQIDYKFGGFNNRTRSTELYYFWLPDAKMKRIIPIIIFILLTTSCGQQTPTIATPTTLPTTLTNTPTSPPPTTTPTTTSIPPPIHTPTSTPTHTQEPTATSTIHPTDTPAPTPTHTATFAPPTDTPRPTAAPTDTPTPLSALADVKITKAYNSGRKEYIELTNTGNAPQNLSGWSISGSKGDERYTFPPDYILAVGASVNLHSGQDGIDAPPDDIYWTTKNVWNNEGETVYLWDGQNAQVDSYSY